MEQRDYNWSSIFAWGLTLSGAVLATGGVIGMFWPEFDLGWLCVVAFAGMMAFGIGLVNCSAAGALHAIKHKKTDGGQVDWAVFLPALACCIGFAFATNIGVHLGWEIVKSNAPTTAKLPPAATIDVVFYIFAFAKPAMAWIVEGRKAMDAEDYAARIAARKKEAAEIAAAETARVDAEAARADAARAEAARIEAERAQAAVETETRARAEAEARVKADAAAAARAQRAAETRARRKQKSEAEKREAALRAVAKRVADFRAPQAQARVHDIEEARVDQPLTPQQIARACDRLIERGETPSIIKVAEILAVPRSRVELSWPKGVPLDGTGEIRAA